MLIESSHGIHHYCPPPPPPLPTPSPWNICQKEPQESFGLFKGVFGYMFASQLNCCEKTAHKRPSISFKITGFLFFFRFNSPPNYKVSHLFFFFFFSPFLSLINPLPLGHLRQSIFQHFAFKIYMYIYTDDVLKFSSLVHSHVEQCS